MRLTTTGLGLLLTSAVLACGAVLLAAPALALAALAGLLALFWGVLSTVTAPRPTGRVSLDTGTIERGGLVTARIRVTPTGLLLRTSVDLDTTAFGPAGVTTVSAGPPEPTQAADHRERTISLRATRHGVVTVGPPVLTQTDPFGLCRRVTRTGETPSLLIRPALVAVARMETLSRARSSTSGRGTATAPGDFDTLRPYEPGDDIRLIHWPNSGRTGVMLVRKHVSPPTREFVVLHDTAAASYATVEQFEEAVDFSASVVAAATAVGQALRLGTTSGPRVWTWPAGDRCTEGDIARAFASVQPQVAAPGPTADGPFSLGRSIRAGLVGTAACTIVTGEPRAELLSALRDSALPMRLTLVSIGPHRPAEPVVRWVRARGASLIHAVDARGAIAQWTMRMEASR
ncbi:DUF58 domain-containing protein (plasmid) [Streptomyces sp. C1-1]|uniref:DUF58 domain-containing protein n=1 Tax=Streptomyces sp. C1-1 TaxID=3231173 RepID=UPI003D06920A